MRSLRAAAAIGALVLVAGCTPTVGGKATGSASTSSENPSPSGAPTRSASASVTPPPDLARTPAETVIGDPVTADLCTAMGLDPLRNLDSGLTPSFDARQYPPGCAVTLRDGTKPVLQVSVYATHGKPPSRNGRTTRMQSGVAVYLYRYDPTIGSCERDVLGPGVRLVVNAYGPGSDVPAEVLSCSGTDAMATRLAAVVADGNVPRIPLASPSLAALDACKVVRKADIRALSNFARSEIIARGFGANCELKTATLFLFLNFAIADSTPPSSATVTSVAGHRLFETDAGGRYCTFVSSQGITTTGRYEQMSATATVAGSAASPTHLCDQTARALARYLTAAGLT